VLFSKRKPLSQSRSCWLVLVLSHVMMHFWTNVCNWQLWLAASLLQSREGNYIIQKGLCYTFCSPLVWLEWFSIDISHTQIGSLRSSACWLHGADLDKLTRAQLIMSALLLNPLRIECKFGNNMLLFVLFLFCFSDLITHRINSN